MHRDDFVTYDEGGANGADGDEDGDDPTGSNSDSDFDIEKKPDGK